MLACAIFSRTSKAGRSLPSTVGHNFGILIKDYDTDVESVAVLLRRYTSVSGIMLGKEVFDRRQQGDAIRRARKIMVGERHRHEFDSFSSLRHC